MIRPSTPARAGVAAASILLGGILLTLPGSIHERSAPMTTPAMATTETPPTQASGAAPPAEQAHRTARAHRPAPPPPATAGMVVGIDPETGQLGMPTPEQMQKLSESQQYQMDHSAAGLVEVHHPDGSVSIDLQGRFQEYETVRVGPDGKLIYRCVDGPENAEHALESPAPPALEER
jgi:hypothetical protein